MKKYAFLYCTILLLSIVSNLSAQEIIPDGAILVVNKTKSSVIIIFTDPEKESITIPTGEGPSEIVISPDRKMAVVSNYGYLEKGRSLTLIDLENFTWLKDIEFGGNVRPNGIAFLPDSKKLLVTFETRKSVGVFDTESNNIIKEIRTNQEKPLQIAVHPTGNAAYVTNEISGTVSIIDLNDFTHAGNIPIGKGIEGIAISPDGKEVWVANKVTNTIHVIETKNHIVTHRFESPVFPTRLKFTPDGKNVIVLNSKSGHLTIIDARTKKHVMYLSTDDFSEILDAEFSLTESSSSFTAIERTKEILDDRMKLLNSGEIAAPVSIEISPNGDYAFISNQVKSSVSIMHLMGEQKFSLAGTYALEYAPGEMAFLPTDANAIEYKTESIIDAYWNSNNPSEIYFTEMDTVSDDDFVKEIETPFLFVLDEDELGKYEALAEVAAKKKYIKNYINDKNENPLYPVNYWFMEYNGRVAHAKENFSLDKPPYIDDRGKFYIKFGEPFRRHQDRGGPKRHEYLASQINSTDPTKESIVINTIQNRMDAAIARLNLPDTYYTTIPNETWFYYIDRSQQFTVHFGEVGYFKELRNGLAGMLDARKREDVAWYWMALVKDRFFLSFELNNAMLMIERWQMEYSGSFDFTDIDVDRNNISSFIDGKIYDLVAVEQNKKLNVKTRVNSRFEETNLIVFDLESAQFKNQNKETRIKFVTYSDPNEINLFSTEDEKKYLNLEMEYLFRDLSYEDIFKDKTTDKFENFEELSSIFLTTESSLLPVDGDLTVQLTNTDTKEIGFHKYPITIRDFTGDDLMLSDILYYAPIENINFENGYTVEEINGSKVIPYPYPFIDKEIPIMCYFEVYNLVIGKEETIYDVEIKLTKDESGKGLFKRLGGLFTNGGEEVRSIKYQISDYENDMKELIGFDLSQIGKGKYDLEVIFTSNINKEITATAKKKLVIK